MRVLQSIVVLGAVVLGLSAPASAKDAPPPPEAPPLADRAKILGIELRRGPACDLEPYLQPDAHPTLRAQAIRALGRIGDRAGAPEWLAKLLGGADTDRRLVLEAAGLSAAKSLEGPVAGYVKDKNPQIAAAAVEALGWIGGDGAIATLAGALHHPDPLVIAAALEGLGRAKAEALLERACAYVHYPEAGVRQAAWFSVWLLAGARRKAATSFGGTWQGEPRLSSQVGMWLGELDAVRPYGILAPIPVLPAEPDELIPLLKAIRGSDERFGQEILARVVATRQGKVMEDVLREALQRGDEKTREAAAEAAAGKERSLSMLVELQGCAGSEADARVREALAVALAKLGDEESAQAVLERKDRPKSATLRVLTELRVLAASKRESSVQQLCDLARSHVTDPAAMLEALSLLEERAGEPATKLVGESLGHSDAYVRAAAVGLVGKHKLAALLPRLDELMAGSKAHAERDIRQAVVEAWAGLIKESAVEGEAAALLRTRIAEAATSDPAFTARAAARDAMKTLDIPGAPTEDPLQPNDWKGLPRPKAPILGVDLTKGEGPLTEAEILTLADRMAADKPEFIVENDVGSFRLAIDPSEAPVHAVSFLLCVASGVYDNTLWHRVVPSFVIQGGDPHGTGNGDAGWSLPDEITRGRFVRGALGMPKGMIRDTGGCQLFVMHSDYRPLDGRYTCYGKVVDGMETVDRIRLGDKTLKVGMVVR